jgi:hypothetical protein
MMSDKPEAIPRNPTISNRQERVAVALASGRTVAAAARDCRVNADTVWTWMKQPAFQARVAELRQSLTDSAIGRLASMMADQAADALLRLLSAESDVVALDAVKAVYDLFVNVTNASELKSRIEQLEASQPSRKAR